MLRHCATWAVASALWAPVGLAADGVHPPGKAFPYRVAEQTFDNGLRLVVVPMPTPGVAAYATWMKVGSRDEVDVGRTGFAHFFEHLMFLGTPTVDAAARESAMLRMAADDNAWTWFDETVYHVTLPSSHLPELLTLEADRFMHLTLTPDDVRREAGAVYGEYRKGKVSPFGQLTEKLYATAFTTHTYAHDTIGFEPDIAAMPTAHAYAAAFFHRMYQPAYATVLVVGDVDPEAITALVGSTMGTWPAGDTARPELPVEPPQEGMRRAHLAWTSPTAPLLAMGWKIPGSNPDSPDVAALALLDELLLGDVGPLQQRLVRDEGLAFAVFGGRDDLVDPCLFQVAVQLRPEADPARVEAVVREEIAKVQQGIDAAWLDKVRTHLRYRTLSSLDEPMHVLETLGWALRRGQGVDVIDRWFATMDAVSADQVADAARRYLVDAGLSVVDLSFDGEGT